MTLRKQAEQEFARYLQHFPAEKEGLTALASQLETDTADVVDRKNMRGHITTSAFVIDLAASPTPLALLIHHKLYALWLQPGGHYEGTVPLWQSALRETEEETGAQNVQLHPWFDLHKAPFDIDSHAIAAQPKKNEGPHIHHDFVYLLTADSTLPLTAQEEEVFDAKWFPLSELGNHNDVRFKRILHKMRQQNIVT
ncbi:NUDIX hydrolase [Glaciimonas soli]|uniref:NUDIX domain-containing protein n=1 Tax=Glaciimonas soli TaxID=2590999 RepID=A0A843YTN9_9BURK|nr:NUDIX domain-containing protein [Glaciimonas soli]MQR01064.1 NUDIX domain-containing protein [Glaciimonas soli]